MITDKQTSKEKGITYLKECNILHNRIGNEMENIRATLDIAIRSEQEIADKRVADVFTKLDDIVLWAKTRIEEDSLSIQDIIDELNDNIKSLKQRLGVK